MKFRVERFKELTVLKTIDFCSKAFCKAMLSQAHSTNHSIPPGHEIASDSITLYRSLQLPDICTKC